MVLSIAFTLISVGAATFLSSDRNCEMLYDRYIKDNVVKICTDAVNDSIWKAKEEIAEQTKSVVDSIPDAVGEPEGKIHDITSGITDFIDSHGKEIDSAVSAIANAVGLDVGEIVADEKVGAIIDEVAARYSAQAVQIINFRLPYGVHLSEEEFLELASDRKLVELFIDELLGIDPVKTGFSSTVDYIERTMIRPVALRMIHIVLWATVFALLRILMSVITAIVVALKKEIPVINTADKLLGMVLGIVGSAAIAMVCAFIVSRVIGVTDSISYMDTSTINSTYIFKYVYYLVAPGSMD